MAATSTKLGSKADAGRSKVQHVLTLAVCSPIVGITRSARTDDALTPRLDGRTGLNKGVIDYSLTEGISNGKCRVIPAWIREVSMKLRSFIMLGTALAFAAPTVAEAAVITYSDRASFNAAVTVSQTEDFNSLVVFVQPNPLVIGDLSFKSSDNSGLHRSVGFNLPGQYLAAQNSGYIQIDIAPGSDSIGLDVSNLFGTKNFTYELSDASGVIGTGSFSRSNAFQFIGFTSTNSDIVQLDIIGEGGTFEAIEDVAIGNADAAVPLPAAFIFGAMSVSILGGLSLRRKSASA